MELNERNIIKYFDIILLADKKDSFFSINEILIPKYFKYETSGERDFLQDIRRELKEFSEFHGYFEWFANGSCRLTEKGLDAKEKGGHLKYKKSLTEKPLDWYKITPIILTLIFGSLTIYFAKLNYDLKLNQSDIVIENDSLKVENARILKLVDSLTIENMSNIDKLNLKKTEQTESTKTD